MPSRASSEPNSRTDCCVSSSARRSKPSRMAAVVSPFEAARPCGELFAASAASAATVASTSSAELVGDGDEPDAGGLVGAELLAGDEVAPRRAGIQFRQQHERDDRRRDADACLGERERAPRPGDDDVARADQPEPPARTWPSTAAITGIGSRRIDRNTSVISRARSTATSAGSVPCCRRLGSKVSARAEGPADVPEHYRPHSRVLGVVRRAPSGVA